MSQGNGKKPNYKGGQKNVSVYLGKKGDWPDELLQLVVQATGCKTESQLFRNLFFQYLRDFGVVDKRTNEPIPEAVEKLRAKAENVRLLPRVLDLEQ